MDNIINKYFSAERLFLLLFLCFVFIFFYIFYSFIHPLIPIDLDDWRYLVRNRLFMPIWGEGNPAKIMPEFLYPFISAIGIYTIFPITKDFIFTLTIVHSIFISLCMTGYTYMFIRLLKKRFSVSNSHSLLFTILFLLFHFLMFRTQESENVYMFYAIDLNCFYNYTLPNILCASIVISLLTSDWLSKEFNPSLKSAIVILILYLALFSNLYSSIILMSYIFVDIMLSYYNNVKEKNRIIVFIKTNKYKFSLIIIWLFVHLFEANGARASASWTNAEPLPDSILKAFMCIFEINISYQFVALSVLLFITLVVMVKKQVFRINNFKLFFSSVLCICYSVLLSAKVLPQYILRPEVNYSFIFYFVLIVSCILVKIYSIYPKTINILPILSLLIYSFINRTSPTFSNLWREYDFATLKTVIEKNTSDIIHADKCGKDTVYIIVPTVSQEDRWMFSDGVNYNNILYKYGIIKHNIHIVMKEGDKIPKIISTQN